MFSVMLLVVAAFCLITVGFMESDGETESEDSEEFYTLSFNIHDADPIEPLRLKAGEPVVRPPDPVCPGLIFIDWDPKLPAVMPAHDLTVYGSWLIDENGYETLEFDTGGGSYIAPMVLKQGETIDHPEDPVWEGYEFLGWDPEIPRTMPLDSMTVHAVWSLPESYEFTLDFNMGGVDSIAPIRLKAGDPVPPIEVPFYEGYTLAWWDPYLPEVMPRHDLTLMPVWSPIPDYQWPEFTITFDTDGGTPIPPITLRANANVTIPDDPVKEGYEFGWWEPLVPNCMPHEDTHVKAIWLSEMGYTLTLLVDGKNYLTRSYVGGSLIPHFMPPTKEGYVFDGWEPELPKHMPEEDIAAHAVWKLDRDFFYVSFDTSGGPAMDRIVMVLGERLILPLPPDREGYDFVGWEPDVPEYMPDRDLEVRAVWQEKPPEDDDLLEKYVGYAEAAAVVVVLLAAVFVLGKRRA